MKRDDLKKLELTDEAIDAIMSLHGKSTQTAKSEAEQAKAEAENLKAQLQEASTTIEGFKAMKPDELKAAADEWKAKAEQAQADAAAQIAALRFETALDGALTGAKAKNPKAVKALLDAANLKYNEADGSIIGLNEQLEKVKADNDYLFESDKPAPRIVSGGNNSNVLDDKVVAAARAAAGLK